MLNPVEELYKFCPSCKFPLAKKFINNKQRLICEKCGFILWSNPRPCVSAIIQRTDKKILLLKRANNPLKNYWCLPGGIIEYDESPEQSVIREIKEETNLDITINKLIGVYLINNDPRGNGIDVIYEGKIVNDTITLSKEHSQFDFFSINKLPTPIAYKHTEAIRDFQQLPK